MGDLVRQVRITALTEGGAQGDARTFTGYLDTGATKTILSSRVAAELGGAFLGLPIPIAGYTARSKLVALQLVCKSCPLLPIVAAVSDPLIARVGLPDVEIIVGQDYLQGGRTRISMREVGGDAVRCLPPTERAPERRVASAGRR